MCVDLSAGLRALQQCAAWSDRCHQAGPLKHVLMHTVLDPAALLRGDPDAAVRACVRLGLRDGTVFGALITAPRSALHAVLALAGTVLTGQRYDETAFSELDAALAQAVLVAGHGRARVALEHNAVLLPRPCLTPGQIGRLAMQALHGTAAETACEADLIAGLGSKCSLEDPAVERYRAALDTHASACCAMAPVAGSLAVYNFVAAPSGHARNRAQAIETLPWLLPMMTSHASGRKIREVSGILAAIDGGLPLFDAVAEAFEVPREVVRGLGRRTLPGEWLVDARRVRRLLTLLSWLPPERRPQTLTAWKCLKALAGTLSAPLGYIDDIDQSRALHRIGDCMRHWLAQTWPHDRAEWASALLDAQDFLRALFESHQTVDGLDAGAADARVLTWCASVRIARVLGLSRAWHTAIAAVTWASATDDAAPHWPAVIASPWEYGDRTIVELTSRAQLRSEGQAMAHCVGSYAEFCRTGNSVVVSLRSDTGVALSTAELHLADNLPHITVGQHRAESNAAPGTGCVRALDALLRHLNGAGQHGQLLRRREFQRAQLAERVRGHGAHRFNRFAQETARRLSSDAACRSLC